MVRIRFQDVSSHKALIMRLNLNPSPINRISMLKTLFPNMSPSPNGPKLPYINPLLRSSYPESITYSKADLTPSNTRPDTEFYASPRFVQHIDEATIAALKKYYIDVLGLEGPAPTRTDTNANPSTLEKPISKPTAATASTAPHRTILDLCTSWTSHLPIPLPQASSTQIVGIGLNAAELSANPLLTRRIVQDLNASPTLPLADSSVDAVICSVSVDYLTKPVEVFRELNRVLVRGGIAHAAFGDRCFAEKVVGKWGRLDDAGRRAWVGGYFYAAGFEGVEEVVIRDGCDWGDKLFVVRGRKS